MEILSFHQVVKEVLIIIYSFPGGHTYIYGDEEEEATPF